MYAQTTHTYTRTYTPHTHTRVSHKHTCTHIASHGRSGWGPIIGVVFFPVQTWILQQKQGLRKGIWLGMALGLAGNIVRSIPVALQETGWSPGFAQSSAAFAMYHTGQILIAASGPLFMGTTTRLA